MAEHTTAREQIHADLQSAAETNEDLPEGSMLMGWIVVAEWMAPSGDQWLSRISGDARGKAAPTWRAQGYLFSALHDGEGFDDGDP